MDKKKLTLVLLLAMTVFMATSVLAVKPFGASYTNISSERAPADAATSNEALAGNVTEIDVTAFGPTQTWQGYYGNVSGTIQLADAADNVMYNWSLASPEGEIYASRNGTLQWTNIQCFNFTASGTFASDVAQRGATSLYGQNLTQIEAAYNIDWDDVDGVNETFSLAGTHESGGGFNHSLFYTNNLEFAEGECLSTHIFSDAGGATDTEFEEVLLYDPTGQDIVFAAILDEPDTLGFDNAYHDFEMLVLEDGHGTDIAATTYYFYVELE